MSRQVAASVNVDVENRRDHMNVLNYVHIKKLWVDDQKPSAAVVFFTHATIRHRRIRFFLLY